VTGLSMRTLFEACCEEVELRAVCAASAKWDAWRAGEPDDMAEGWIIAHRRAGKFTDALLAKIASTEAQMRADAERIAKSEERLCLFGGIVNDAMCVSDNAILDDQGDCEDDYHFDVPLRAMKELQESIEYYRKWWAT
jgi:hypothetical protein